MEPQKLHEVALQFAWTWYRIRRLIDFSLAEGGSSLARVRLLTFLDERPGRLTDIASFFGQTPRTVTQAVDWLEAKGHVRRTDIPSDRRAKLIEITEAGRALLKAAEPLYHGILARTFGELALEELSSLSGTLSHLDALVDRFEAKDVGPSELFGC